MFGCRNTATLIDSGMRTCLSGQSIALVQHPGGRINGQDSSLSTGVMMLPAQDVTKDDFQLPNLGTKLEAARDEVHSGPS